jgi:alkylation response protein AidB-like acyl-CoA dehydrogenase
MPSGEATPAAGGFTVKGEWKYASLIHDATWITANTRRTDTGEVMAVAVPPAQVDIADDWQVHALSATDSHSIRMGNVAVPASHTFRLDHPPRLDAPLYRFPFDALAAASFAAVAVGIARGAVRAFREGLETRRSSQAAGLAVREQRLARAAGLQQSAWDSLSHAVDTAWRQVTGTGALEETLDTGVHLAAVTATAQAVDAVEALAQVAGMSLLYEHDRLGRCWRDVHGVAQHAYISASREQELGGRLSSP